MFSDALAGKGNTIGVSKHPVIPMGWHKPVTPCCLITDKSQQIAKQKMQCQSHGMLCAGGALLSQLV